MEDEIAKVHKCKCVSLYALNDKKPKAVQEHGWTAIVLKRERG